MWSRLDYRLYTLQGMVALKPEFDFLPGGVALGFEVKMGKSPSKYR